ncbi:MAG: hypothetical protein ACREQW_20995, partial [Candidatus Binatia bacterium]
FDTKRYSGQRLIFHAAAAGLVFLTIGFAVTRLVVDANYARRSLAAAGFTRPPVVTAGKRLHARGIPPAKFR